MTYRPEIDGLRAVAVVPVVLFHLAPDLVPGGFVGVDVFFVISGFLITSIILREKEAGTFTLRRFWMRRVRRLFPALAAVLLTTTVAAWFILYEPEWRALGSQLLAVLLLVANVHLHRETGDYWGPASEELPLLHTWSLAVEEQFYLLFPLLILLLLALGTRTLLPTLALGTLASLAFCIATTPADPSAAFFLLPARAWELLLGCLLAAWHWRRPRAIGGHALAGALALLGLAAIVTSCVLLTGENFPGSRALLPTAGAVLVIAGTASGRGPVHRLLSLPPFVFTGRISYSLYLWHWPLIVFWKLSIIGDVSTPRHAIPIFLLSFAAASLSYFMVEQPFRRPAWPLQSRKGAAVIAAYAALFLTAHTLRSNHLAPRSTPAFAAPEFTAHQFSAARDDVWRAGGVIVGTDKPDLVVIGSSHAIMYGSTIADIARTEGRTVSFLALGNAFGRFHTEGDEAILRDGMADQREEFDRVRRTHLEQWKPRHTLWIGRWDNQYEILGGAEFERIMRRNLDLLLEDSQQIVLFTQPPFSMERRRSLVRYADVIHREGRPVVGREDPWRNRYRRGANAVIRRIVRDDPRLSLVEVLDLFDLGEGRVRLLSPENDLLYHDYDHLSDHGAALVRDRLEQALSPLFPKR